MSETVVIRALNNHILSLGHLLGCCATALRYPNPTGHIGTQPLKDENSEGIMCEQGVLRDLVRRKGALAKGGKILA